MITPLDMASFDKAIVKGNWIIDFWADWCGPCKIMEPEFEKAAKQMKDVKFGKVNVDGNQGLAGRYGILSIPTTLFLQDGEQVDRHTGPLTAVDIKKIANKSF